MVASEKIPVVKIFGNCQSLESFGNTRDRLGEAEVGVVCRAKSISLPISRKLTEVREGFPTGETGADIAWRICLRLKVDVFKVGKKRNELLELTATNTSRSKRLPTDEKLGYNAHCGHGFPE